MARFALHTALQSKHTSKGFYIEKKHVKSSHTKHYTIGILSNGNYVQFNSSKDPIFTEMTF